MLTVWCTYIANPHFTLLIVIGSVEFMQIRITNCERQKPRELYLFRLYLAEKFIFQTVSNYFFYHSMLALRLNTINLKVIYQDKNRRNRQCWTQSNTLRSISYKLVWLNKERQKLFLYIRPSNIFSLFIYDYNVTRNYGNNLLT